MHSIYCNTDLTHFYTSKYLPLNIFDANLSKSHWGEYNNRSRDGRVNPNHADNSNTRFDATAYFVIVEQCYLKSQLQGFVDEVSRYNKRIEWLEEMYSNHTFDILNIIVNFC